MTDSSWWNHATLSGIIVGIRHPNPISFLEAVFEHVTYVTETEVQAGENATAKSIVALLSVELCVTHHTITKSDRDPDGIQNHRERLQ